MKSDLHDLKKLTLELMENGSSKVQETNKISLQKYMGLKNDSEIDFEEEPRTALMMSQNNEETYQENDDNYLCRNCRRGRRSIEAGTKRNRND
jgi:hypothetical protein